MTMKKHLAAVALLVTLLAWGAPAFALSDKDEMKFGKQVSQEVERRFGLWKDPVQEERVKRLARYLLPHTSRKLPYQFKIADMRDDNAFALPGGTIYLTRGLLQTIQDDDRLAGVMAHEIAHVEQRHFARMYDREMRENIWALLILIATGGKAGKILNVASYIDQFILEPQYSRKDESQADLAAVETLYRAGFNPGSLAALFEEWHRSGKDRGGIIPDWMKSHPNLSQRSVKIREALALYPPIQPPPHEGVLLQGEVIPDDDLTGVVVDQDELMSDRSSFRLERLPDGMYRVSLAGGGEPREAEFFTLTGHRKEIDSKDTHRPPFEVTLKGVGRDESQRASLLVIHVLYRDRSLSNWHIPLEHHALSRGDERDPSAP